MDKSADTQSLAQKTGVFSLFQEPVLIAKNKAASVLADLESLFQSPEFKMCVEHQASSSGDDFWPEEEDDWRHVFRPYDVQDGVLRVPVYGVLMNHLPWTIFRWATGYDYIEAAVARGLEDDEVDEIVLDTESPGGGVAGVFELTDKIYQSRNVKKISAFAFDYAFSAAYSLASAAEEITVSRSGMTGSVGVIMMHMDLSKYLEQAGIKVTFIQAGKLKKEGNSFEPLSAAAEKRFQKSVDKSYDLFVSTVARNRDMDESAVRETEAGVFDSEDSVSVGFADNIGNLFEDMQNSPAEDENQEQDTGDDQMATAPKKITAPKAPPKTKTASDEPQSPSEDALETAREEGFAEGAAHERERFSTVLASEEHTGREGLAQHLLSTTDMSAENVVAALQASPVSSGPIEPEEPTSKKESQERNHFAEKMSEEATPEVGADAGGTAGSGDEKPSATSQLRRANAKAMGRDADKIL